MTLWAAQLGYLHATPKGEDTTRWAEFVAAGETPDLPALGVAQHVAEAFYAMKPMRGDIFRWGDGSLSTSERPADWPEIVAFARATGRVRETWELEALADMCRAYHRELMAGANPLRIAPIDRRP